MSPSSKILEMHNVSKSFPDAGGQVNVLNQVNICLSRGEFLGITGPSGSGKSTLLHLAGLLDHPTSGKVSFDGHDVSALGEPRLCFLRRQEVGMVFQKYCLLPHRSVLENVKFRFRYLDHDQKEVESCAMQALETVGLSSIGHRPVRLLSGGEKQRVAIARAVANRPQLLIADEPTGNLDRSSTGAVMDCFQRLNQTGITILMVTHNESLLEFCSRRLVCEDGMVRD